MGVILIPVARLAWIEAYFLYFGVRERLSRRPFESQEWKAYRPQWGVSRTNYWAFALPARLRMVDDLMARHDLRGRGRDEITTLLGPKESTQYFSDWDLVYYLGPGRYGDAIGDSEWLVIRFDAADKVREYRVVHD